MLPDLKIAATIAFKPLLCGTHTSRILLLQPTKDSQRMCLLLFYTPATAGVKTIDR